MPEARSDYMFEQPRLRTAKGRKLAVMALAAGILMALAGCGDNGENAGQNQGQPPAPVTVTTVQSETVHVTGRYPGRVQGARNVEVRARVEGILERRLYTEGQVVEEGTPLFRIDPEPTEIALARAKAEQADARASVTQAERNWERISALFDNGNASRRDRDQAETGRQMAEARLALAAAAVADAERNLRYTEVVAPISGVTGLETLSEGSLIERGALLTTVTQRDPVHIRIALPENDAAIQRLARRAMTGDAENGHYRAQVLLPDGTSYNREGAVDFTASTIDPRTGTVSIRAVFDNPDGELIPGQFVRLRIMLQTLDGVFLIDPAAVSEGPGGPQVFVVTDESRASARAVTLGPTEDGRQIITQGLKDGDRLVINGHVALRDGAPVEATSAPEEAKE